MTFNTLRRDQMTSGYNAIGFSTAEKLYFLVYVLLKQVQLQNNFKLNKFLSLNTIMKHFPRYISNYSADITLHEFLKKKQNNNTPSSVYFTPPI